MLPFCSSVTSQIMMIMTFMGITSFRQNIVTGMVFIVVVGLQQYRLRVGGRSDQ